MAESEIDPTAVVHAEATIGDHCVIGPKVVLGPEVILGAGNHIGAGVLVMGRCTIGSGNLIEAEGSLGASKFELASSAHDCGIEIGDDNEIAECVTINRGCPPGPGLTRIGNACVLMAGCHIGPDCSLADGVIIGEDTYLDESVKVGPRAVVGSGASVKGFIRIGTMACVAAEMVLGKDVPPYLRAEGQPPSFPDVYAELLEDADVPGATIDLLRRARELLFDSGTPWLEAVAELRTWKSSAPELRALLTFVETIPP